MTFLDAADHAKKAESAARTAKSYYTDHEDRKLAEAVQNLAKAVEAMAEQLHRDS